MDWACLLLPHLALDAVLREQDDPERPLVLIEGPLQRRMLHSTNPAARALGLRRGMSLSAAQVLASGFAVHPYDAAHEERARKLLASWLYGYSSQVTLDFPHALALEIRASRALFGNWQKLGTRLRAELLQLGFRHRLVIAPNPHAARALANVHANIGIDADGLEHALASLPVARSGLPGSTCETLQRSGLDTLGAALAIPRDSMARRFPPDVLQHLDALRGRPSRPLRWFQPPDRFEARIEFEHEIESSQSLLFPLRRLTGDLAAFLRSRDGGAQQFVLVFEHERHAPTTLVIGLLSPQRDATMLFDLARSRMEHLALPAACRGMQLCAEQLPPFVPISRDLFDSRPAQAIGWDDLRERLRARLGDEAVQPLQLHADHRPERADAAAGKAPAAGRLPQRPGWLLPRPMPWHGHIARILRGPERIESGWWDSEDIRRDYYVVETPQGQRAWVYAPPGQDGPFMLHGWFA